MCLHGKCMLCPAVLSTMQGGSPIKAEKRVEGSRFLCLHFEAAFVASFLLAFPLPLCHPSPQSDHSQPVTARRGQLRPPLTFVPSLTEILRSKGQFNKFNAI